jgi:rhodanese-related sulfurtransferase
MPAMSAHPFASELSPESVAENQRGDSRWLIVDVRSPGEFASERIHGTQNIPLDELSSRTGELARGTPLVCVCQSGQRSGQARDRLAAAGFEFVTSLQGGINAWKRAGLPLEKTPGAPWSLERQVRVAAGALVLAGAAGGTWLHPALYGLSAFVGAGLVFAGITNWCGMGLLLARAPWNQVKLR